LNSGEYTIHIKDTNGCIVEEKASLISTKGPELNTIKVKNETFHGEDGEIITSEKMEKKN
jgi:hypothetical protein